MEVNIDKMICNLSCIEELSPLKYFKQFNVYQNIHINNKKLHIYNIENTTPNIEVDSTKIIETKIIETMKGTSLEGQHLSGKNLIIVGNINMSLILSYGIKQKKNKNLIKKDIVNVNIPFSTYIVIPKDICNTKKIDLRYYIEDVTVVKLSTKQLLASVTMLIQYLDEY